MTDFPTGLLDFGRRFCTDEACQEYMISVRWPGGFKCPNCKTGDPYWIKSRRVLECRKCRRQHSLTAGTVMHRTKTPLCSWFVGAYLMTSHTPGLSAVQFQRQAEIPRYETAFQMLHKLRAAMVRPCREKLEGVVEVDETFIGGRKKGPRGRGAKGKTLVAIAVEDRNGHAGRVRLKRIPNAGRKSLAKFLQSAVEPRTVVRTDGWKGYDKIEDDGYRHEVVTTEVPEQTSGVLPHAHRAASNLKTWLTGTHHGVSPKHLQAYLNEFGFRFNRRGRPMAAFNTVLRLGVEAEAPTYEGLYDAGESGGWEHPFL